MNKARIRVLTAVSFTGLIDRFGVRLAGKYRPQWPAVFPRPSLFWQRLVVLVEERLLVSLRIEDECHLASKTNAHK